MAVTCQRHADPWEEIIITEILFFLLLRFTPLKLSLATMLSPGRDDRPHRISCGARHGLRADGDTRHEKGFKVPEQSAPGK